MIIIEVLGGLGLFLLGMIVMTDGLKTLAGSVMRRALMQFTHTPISGVLTGAISTAVLQSSSATTVATVGFVRAGLIPFSAALGIILGANIGTTMTGWLVAILGFKLKLGTIMLPLIFVGTSLKLFFRGRVGTVGITIAGFGLIFVGITTMQTAMDGVEQFITPAQLPPDTWFGRLQLVALGILSTIITQSSSAGVATTLAALYAGAVNFNQAAALVIGMDVGTTVTAVIASVGGSLNARRTGLSHVFYNFWTAFLALQLITPYTWLWNQFWPGALIDNAEIALVAFHTSFNFVGITLLLPFLKQFAWVIMRIVPGEETTYTDELNEALLEQPELALNAAQKVLEAELLALVHHIAAILGDTSSKRVDLVALQTALDDTHAYLDRIHLSQTANPNWERLINLIHALDHLQRLHERCEEDEDRAQTARATPELMEESQLLLVTLQNLVRLVQEQRWQTATEQAKQASALIHHKVKSYRVQTVNQTANGQIDVLTGTARLEAIRWLRRVSKHVSRSTFHLYQAILAQ